jgi:hypothetical protein
MQLHGRTQLPKTLTCPQQYFVKTTPRSWGLNKTESASDNQDISHISWNPKHCLINTNTATHHCFYHNQLQDHMFRPQSAHLQAIKLHKIKISSSLWIQKYLNDQQMHFNIYDYFIRNVFRSVLWIKYIIYLYLYIYDIY